MLPRLVYARLDGVACANAACANGDGPVSAETGSRAVTATVVGAGVIAALYYGQIVLIPVALALFLTFLLAPIVRGLQRLGLGRVVAILLVGLASYAALGAVALILTRQATSLVGELPRYRTNIREKIADKSAGPGTVPPKVQPS